MRITASQLRGNIYKLLDRVLDTGEELEILRHGRLLKIRAEHLPGRLERLVERPDFIEGDPEALIHTDWSDTWKPSFT